MGDFDLDGDADADDRGIILASQGIGSFYTEGDFDCDGDVDSDDLDAWDAANGTSCPADVNGDGQVNFFDVSAFLNAYNAMDLSVDFNNDGVLNFFDVSAFLAFYSQGCP
jgi:hypothetical protein